MRPLQQVARQLQPAGDLQGVAHAELADVQPVRRPQRLHVELDGAVLGPLVVERIRFQIAQMGRDHRPAAARVEVVEDGPAQRRPLRRVGAGAQFVEQHQALCVGLLEDGGDPRYVRAEGAERLFQALLVADVGQDVVEDRARCCPRRPGCACRDWAIRQSSPAVLRQTVLPPVFGPVMMSRLKPMPRRMSMGTTSSSGGQRCEASAAGDSRALPC